MSPATLPARRHALPPSQHPPSPITISLDATSAPPGPPGCSTAELTARSAIIFHVPSGPPGVPGCSTTELIALEGLSGYRMPFVRIQGLETPETHGLETRATIFLTIGKT